MPWSEQQQWTWLWLPSQQVRWHGQTTPADVLGQEVSHSARWCTPGLPAMPRDSFSHFLSASTICKANSNSAWWCKVQPKAVIHTAICHVPCRKFSWKPAPFKSYHGFSASLIPCRHQVTLPWWVYSGCKINATSPVTSVSDVLVFTYSDLNGSKSLLVLLAQPLLFFEFQLPKGLLHVQSKVCRSDILTILKCTGCTYYHAKAYLKKKNQICWRSSHLYLALM